MDSINPTGSQAARLPSPTFTVVNDTAPQGVSDTFSPSGATDKGSTRKYQPHYQFGKVLHSCGAFDGFMVAEAMSIADACKLRDQLDINVRGLPAKTPDVYQDVKPFENLPSYTWGMVDTTASCGNVLTLNWTISSNEVGSPAEAKQFCKKYHIPFKP